MRHLAETLPMNSDSMKLASEIVLHGGLIVYPTDTVYGLGGNPRDAGAVERVFAAKQRETKPMPILVSGLPEAERLVEFDKLSLALARKHWPGPLTLVLPMKEALPLQIHQGTGSVGVRVPGSEDCRRLISACGGSLTGTSANLSGRPSSRTAAEALAELGKVVDLVLDGGHLSGIESTVIRVGKGAIEVLREGPIRVSDATDPT